MKLAVLTCGMLPIPAVQGGAVENLIDFYLEYNDIHKLHDITVYSPWEPRVVTHPALSSSVNHYIYIDVCSRKARLARRIYKYFHSNEYYNYFIEYYFEKVYRELKQHDYDCILLENCPGYAYKLSQRGYHDIILHLHNDLLNSKTKFHDNISKNLAKVITVSDYIKERVSTIYPNNQIKTVHNGIDTHRFSPKDHLNINRQDIGFSKDDFVIVYSGRINPEKGVSELIDAMLQLKDYTHIKLMILGSSFFQNATHEDDFICQLKNKAESIKDMIIFTGYIPYDQVPDYLHLADIAVLPSMWEEPFGLTIVEAMAAGLPLITTRSGGIPEICENTSIIIDRENVVSNLIGAITYLYLNQGKRKQMSTAAIEQAKYFSKDTYAKNLFDALVSL